MNQLLIYVLTWINTKLRVLREVAICRAVWLIRRKAEIVFSVTCHAVYVALCTYDTSLKVWIGDSHHLWNIGKICEGQNVNKEDDGNFIYWCI